MRGMAGRRWIAAVAWMLVACTVTEAADPPYYAKKGTWQDTLVAAREALLKYEQEQSTSADAAETVKGVTLGTWYMAGPFATKSGDGFSYVFPPERGVDVAKPMGQFRWVPQQFEDGAVHGLTAGGNESTYLYRTITAGANANVMGYFGSDDGIAAWLNGKKILSNNVSRGAGENQDRARLRLKKGQNHLLLKIYNRGGGHGFYFSLTGKAKRGRKDPRQVARQALWKLVQRDFRDGQARGEMTLEQRDGIWNTDWQAGDVKGLAARYVAATRMPRLAEQAKALAANVKNAAGLHAIRKVYYKARDIEEMLARGGDVNFQAMHLAITDLAETFGDRYPKGKEFLTRLGTLQERLEKAQAKDDKAVLLGVTKDLVALQREALLANPLLDAERLMFIRRGAGKLGLPQNWTGNSAIGGTGYDNEIVTVPMRDPQGERKMLYRPDGSQFVGDVDLHFNADRMLFSMIGTHGRWQVWEIRADGTGLRQVTKGEHADVDNYDPCYLPDGRIIYCSTVGYQGVPCVGGGSPVGALMIATDHGENVRQLTFDQDHSWCPTVLNSGRIMYTRWEYSDTPHYFSRILFEMNPDGTAQFELYGSNSYWPNSTFYARPIPGHPTKVVAIISGHHGVPRMGELLIFDPAKGKHEADGVVQRIPGYGKKVEPIIRDGLVNGSWPKFLHPYPLSEKYFLVSCQMNSKASWNLYLVDVFDNMLLLRQEAGYALFEPVPLRRAPRPPVVPDKVDLSRKDAVVYMANVYMGDGLKGVPKGTVKALRVFTNHYGYRGMGGHINIGIDGPWDAKRILGTVPVYEDGSAMFRVPANVPIVLEPLDAEGKALQVMRSWYTAMPGEFASCVGCHERQSQRPPTRHAIATGRKPSQIKPWHGPARGFSFDREVQPVLDTYCVGCHNGTKKNKQGMAIPDFRRSDKKAWRGFSAPYVALHPYVRRPGPESDYHLPAALEYHADTSELVQMLQKGHSGVQLDADAWDRIITWIDLNVPCHGTWSEYRQIRGDGRARRLALAKEYANLDIDPEAYPVMEVKPAVPVKPKPVKRFRTRSVPCKGWPFDAAEARRRQAAAGTPARTIDLGDGVTLELVRIPAGEFVMGSADAWLDEGPPCRVAVAKPFWVAAFETTNAQYALFDPMHNSEYISVYNKDQGNRGEAANKEKQPVIRVTWQEAMAFCAWLSKKTGQTFTLPTEAQWEYACRAGTATAMNYGPVDADFSKFANFADQRLVGLCRRDSPKWIPHVADVNDGDMITANYDRHQPNPWGLHDMHGNVSEWTRSTFKPYPYRVDDGRNAPGPEGRKVVRGGSFYDRPKRGRSAFRLHYPSWQKVYHVGFRVITEDEAAKRLAVGSAE